MSNFNIVPIGRNLFSPGSLFPNKGFKGIISKYGVNITPRDIIGERTNGVYFGSNYVKDDQTYTLSCKARGKGSLVLGSDIEKPLIYQINSEDWKFCYSVLTKGLTTTSCVIYADDDVTIDVKEIKLEEGSIPTPWCPSLNSCEVDFIKPNLIDGTSDNWSEWVSPVYNIYNHTGVFYTITHEVHLEDIYNIGIEVEFDEVEADKELGLFAIQGDVNGVLEYVNPFTQRIIYLKDIQNKVYSNTHTTVVKDAVNNNVVVYEGKTTYSVGYRCDYWKSGRFRYRKYYAKKGPLNNPIWCKSEIDVANPNLAWFSYVNSVFNYEEGLDFDSLSEKIEINDCPNPHIQEGWHLKRRDETQVHVFGRGIDKIEKRHTETVTFSIYYKIPRGVFAQSLYLQYQVLNDSGNSIKKYFYYVDIGIRDTWVRAVLTIDFQKLIQENPGGKEVNIEHFWGNLDEFYVCGVKLEKGDKVTAWVPYVSTTNLLTNTNEGLTIKPSNIDLEEYTFESNIPQSTVKKAKSLSLTDNCYVNEVEDAPFNVTKSVHINAINKDIGLNKDIFIENNNKELTFSLYLKGNGKISMHFIPKEKEIDGVNYGGYKIGNDFEATDEWQLCSINSYLFDEFNISIVANKGSEVELCAFKLEEGNKVSDWCDYQDPEEMFPEIDYSQIQNI